MKSIYMLMHERKENYAELAGRVASAMRGAGITVVAEPWLYEAMGERGLFAAGEPQNADAIVSVGGDGTLLRANALAMPCQLPVFGINVGRVGFLTEIELDELEEACEKLACDAYTIENRMILEAKVNGQKLLALNDVVISRGGYSRLISLNAYVGGELVGRYIADGMIVATSTGSTGYSLSAGGPIVCPNLECMLITPVCAHSLQHRPVVTSADQTITISLDGDLQAGVSVDGKGPFPLNGGESLSIVRSSQSARFIRLEPGNFFHKIRIKLSEWSC